MSFSLADFRSYPGKNIVTKRFSQWHTRNIPALSNTAHGTEIFKVPLDNVIFTYFYEILTRSLRDLYEIWVLQGKAAGQGTLRCSTSLYSSLLTSLVFSTLRCSTLLYSTLLYSTVRYSTLLFPTDLSTPLFSTLLCSLFLLFLSLLHASLLTSTLQVYSLESLLLFFLLCESSY